MSLQMQVRVRAYANVALLVDWLVEPVRRRHRGCCILSRDLSLPLSVHLLRLPLRCAAVRRVGVLLRAALGSLSCGTTSGGVGDRVGVRALAASKAGFAAAHGLARPRWMAAPRLSL